MKVSFPILLKSEGDHWITIHPHGKGAVGKYGDPVYRRIKIDSSGNIVGRSVPKELYDKPIHDAFRKQRKPHPHLSKHLNDIGVEHTMELKDNGHLKKLFEEGESGVKKSLRTKSEWRQVKRTKRDEYGTHETFADTKHDSYPLTKGGKPSRERTLAAWRYINVEHDEEEYSDTERERIKAKIRKFAKDHFGLDLKDGGIEKSLCVVFQIR